MTWSSSEDRRRPFGAMALARLWGWVRVAVVAALVLLAVLLTLVRLALPLVESQGERVSAALATLLGSETRLGGLALHLDGLNPRLVLRDVTLGEGEGEGGGPILALSSLDLELDLLASLSDAGARIRGATLHGARLSARIDRQGTWRIDGLERLRSGDPEALAFFMREGRLDLVESRITLVDERRDGAGVRLDGLRLSLGNDAERHRLSLSAMPSALDPTRRAGQPAWTQPLGRLGLIAELRGAPQAPATWSGRVYGRVETDALDEILSAWATPPWGIDGQRARLEVWGRVQSGGLEQVLLQADLTSLALALDDATDAAPDLRLDRLRATARVSPLERGWRVELADLSVRLDAGTAPSLSLGLDLDLQVGADLSPRHLRLAAAPTDLGALGGVLAALSERLPESARSWLAAAPRGRIDDLQVALDWAGSAPPEWRLEARLADLGWSRLEALPGASGLDLRLSATARGGVASLETADATLDLAPLFDQPLAVDRLAGQLDWTLDGAGGWRVAGRDLELANADLHGTGWLRVEHPAGGDGPLLDLRARFKDGDAARVRTYLPVGRMHPRLVAWLTRSIQGGRVTEADIILRGPLAAFPFRAREGRFEASLAFADATLDYLAGWPRIEQAGGRIIFLDESLAIEVERGRILDSSLVRVDARIPDLRGVRQMRIEGQVEGPFADGRRILAETPLAKRLGRLAKTLEVGGASRLDLRIDLPFNKSVPLGIDGRLTWPEPATLAIRDTPIELTRLGGALSFTTRDISAERVTAELGGRPLELAIETLEPAGGTGATTRIEARARTPVERLAERLPHPLWSVVSGELDWTLSLSVPHRDIDSPAPTLDYRLTASLSDLAIALPEPLGKSADTEGRLDLAGALVPGRHLGIAGQLGALAIDLDQDLATRAAPRGALRLGGEPAPAAERDGLWLDGQVTALDLPAWWQSLRALDRAGSGAASRTALPLAGLDLRIGVLDLGGLDLRDLDLTWTPDPRADRAGGWDIQARGPALSGRLLHEPGAEVPLRLMLERLALDQLLAPGEAASSARTETGNPFARLPAIDARVDDLRWGEVRLGTLSLGLRPDSLGVRLPSIQLGGGDGGLSAHGDAAWRDVERGGRGELALELEAPDLGRLLQTLSARNRVEGAPTRAALMLEWPGGFGDLALARASGYVDLKIGAGRLLEIEPGVGRVLGFLNLDALKRRLAMDFSDLYAQGFAFEEMKGRIRVAEGRADLDAFTIDGPSSRIVVTGSSDLVSQRFDQRVSVEPKLGSSVALASAVAGGPVVGAAVYLVDRIAGSPFDRLGRYRYRVTGPWLEPEVTRVGWDPSVGQADDGAPVESAPARPVNHFLE